MSLGKTGSSVRIGAVSCHNVTKEIREKRPCSSRVTCGDNYSKEPADETVSNSRVSMPLDPSIRPSDGRGVHPCPWIRVSDPHTSTEYSQYSATTEITCSQSQFQEAFSHSIKQRDARHERTRECLPMEQLQLRPPDSAT